MAVVAFYGGFVAVFCCFSKLPIGLAGFCLTWTPNIGFWFAFTWAVVYGDSLPAGLLLSVEVEVVPESY